MAKIHIQTTESVDNWCKFEDDALQTPPRFEFVPGNPSMEKTTEVFREKVWSFSDALKGVAEALVGYGVSPLLLGYSSVSSTENDYMQKQEGEAALQKVSKKEGFFSRTASSSKSISLTTPASGEEVGLMQQDQEDDDHMLWEPECTVDEQKPWTRQISVATVEKEDGHLQTKDD
ncbi:hypothetical protein O6H91_08G061800 [Diphasiastrum complanatum]|uniref:Uncharacterized protein n=3 Tax=Diphasiastrum complanatum TaxID=34168 RepID=A0ACC2CY75_DIPCM|nr:hypothetical protein O6H91_08G061800 [Diphasiastrum complanatum]KAJ7546935.1 hypothetical protein O6H91_08G061800 [Diphasiastrum complanatum]KAJ7546936.1 hypothetical protein O6H91_08G061800 [Diphasiastrum complanatum]